MIGAQLEFGFLFIILATVTFGLHIAPIGTVGVLIILILGAAHLYEPEPDAVQRTKKRYVEGDLDDIEFEKELENALDQTNGGRE